MKKLKVTLEDSLIEKLDSLGKEYCRTREQEIEYRIKQGLRVPGHIDSRAISMDRLWGADFSDEDEEYISEINHSNKKMQ